MAHSCDPDLSAVFTDDTEAGMILLTSLILLDYNSISRA